MVPPWKTGDKVEITFGERTVDGEILLASENSKSLMLGFEAILGPGPGLGGYVGMMPVMWVENEYRDLKLNQRVGISVARGAAQV